MNTAWGESSEVPSVFTPVTEERFNGFLSAAFRDRPGWMVREREAVPSFQQSLQRIRVEWPDRASLPEPGGSRDPAADRTGDATGAIPGETVYLRVYRGYLSWWTLATPDLPRREQTAWRVAARAGVPVPETLWTLESPEIAAALLRASPGQAVGDVTMTDALEVELGRMLARLHRAPLEPTDRRHLPDITLPVLFPRLIGWAEEVGADDLASSARRLQEQFREEIEDRPAVFLHGDFHGGNVLVDDDGATVTAVIDWEEAAWGDPRLDVCVMENLLRRRCDGAGQSFVAAYDEAMGVASGPLKPWADLCGVRSRIVGVWVKERVARGDPLPTTRPQAWYR